MGELDVGADSKPSSARVLVVEDDEMVSKMIARFLEPRYSVAHAANGRDALEAIKAGKPDFDLVVTDVRMPVMDGLQLVRAVRRMRPSLPVVVITGLGSEETAVEALRAGATNYLKKPFRANDLDLVVRKCLELAQVRRNRVLGFSFLRDSMRTFELPARLENAKAVLPLMTEGLVELGLIEPADLLNVEVALAEALSNAVLHGALELTEAVEQLRADKELFERAYAQRIAEAPWASARIGVYASLTQDQATFVVEDPGPGFDASALPPQQELSTLQGLKGRGLMLIRLFMDEVVHENGGRRLRMVKRAARRDATGVQKRPSVEEKARSGDTVKGKRPPPSS